MSSMKVYALAYKLTDEILNVGLKKSTWAKHHPMAYRELLTYRPDIARSIINSIEKDTTND